MRRRRETPPPAPQAAKVEETLRNSEPRKKPWDPPKTPEERFEKRLAKTEQELRHAERKKRALQLRAAGLSYEQIGEQMDCDTSTAFRLVKDALSDIPKDEAKTVLAMELRRLDAMQIGVWSNATRGDPKAIAAVDRIMTRRAAYLGLDAPKKTELTGADGGPLSLEIGEASGRVRGRLALAPLGVGAGVLSTKPRRDAG